MLEVNLGDLENSNGEQAEYWLLGIQAGRMACTLTQANERTELQQAAREGQ